MSTGVIVDFNANLARFTNAIDKASNDLGRFQSNAERISGNISKSFAALGVAGAVTAFAVLVKGSIDAQDHLNDLSKTTRLTVEQLSGLASASRKSGSDLDGTAKAISKLSVEMGKNSEKFAGLGITAKNPLEAFAQLADVMNAIDDPQKRAAVGAIALGKSWQESAPLMAEGGKAIRQMIEDGQRLSKVTTESAKAADEFNDRWEDIKTRAGGWVTAVANPIVAGILKIADALNMEIEKKPGSIAEFLGMRSKGYTGAKDAMGLPTTAPAAAGAPKAPSSAAVNKFIDGAGSKGKTDLQRMIELGQKNLSAGTDSEEEQRILAASRAMKDANEEFSALQRMLKVGEDNELAAYYETAGEETMRLVAEQRALQKTFDETTEFAREAARNIQDSLADGLFDIMQGKFDSIGSSFKTMLDRMVANAVAADLGKRLLGDMGKTGEIGGWVGKALGASGGGGNNPDEAGSGVIGWLSNLLPKFAEGTPYVQRTGLAVIHEGEAVLTRDENRNRGGFNGNIIIHVNGASSAPDVRRAAGQGAREALAAFAGAQRYG